MAAETAVDEPVVTQVDETHTQEVSADSLALQLPESAGDNAVSPTVQSLVVKPYEPPKAPDFNFFKSRTNPAVKPYKFLDDQTWVGVPLFFAGMIAKSEKTAFRQD
ncbi:MAG: hypothetical protein II087_06485, partial [Muribaculaceae bacterium]|nr:hypothetical protein [Muribaculaceae bacterium]